MNYIITNDPFGVALWKYADNLYDKLEVTTDVDPCCDGEILHVNGVLPIAMISEQYQDDYDHISKYLGEFDYNQIPEGYMAKVFKKDDVWIVSELRTVK